GCRLSPLSPVMAVGGVDHLLPQEHPEPIAVSRPTTTEKFGVGVADLAQAHVPDALGLEVAHRGVRELPRLRSAWLRQRLARFSGFPLVGDQEYVCLHVLRRFSSERLCPKLEKRKDVPW